MLLKRTNPDFYIGMRLTNKSSTDIVNWLYNNNIPNPYNRDDIHITVIHSKDYIHWNDLYFKTPVKIQIHNIDLFDNRLVLLFRSRFLTSLHNDLKRKNKIQWHQKNYNPHITVSDKVGRDFNLNNITLPKFPVFISNSYFKY